VVNEALKGSILSLGFDLGMFQFRTATRKQATQIQHWLYGVNKENAGGRRYATRYNAEKGELMIWRMA
jgi:hypothetical protein